MNVAVLWEESGVVRDAFIEAGCRAMSCDLVDSRSLAGPHIKGDCRLHDWSDFDLVIAHPPCTYLCNSGVRWLRGNDRRQGQMAEAAEFFRWCLIVADVVENPIPHRHAALPRYRQIVQPWQFGQGEVKRTCLWLRDGVPDLVPTEVVSGRVPRVHRMPPSATRTRDRSVTVEGIARAMAAQWAGLSFAGRRAGGVA